MFMDHGFIFHGLAVKLASKLGHLRIHELFILLLSLQNINYRSDVGGFGFPPTIVKFQPQLFKT
jgi:hypothetical protein